MHIWQAIWGDDHRLYLMAEDAASAAEAAVEVENQRHPFACDTESLNRDCELVEFAPDGNAQCRLIIPSLNNFPLASTPAVFVNIPADKQESILMEWELEAVFFEALPAVSFLTSIPATEPMGIRYGDSLRFWLEVTKLLLDLLSKGKFIPDLINVDGNYLSRWQLVLTEEEDIERLRVLSNAMPHVCCASIQPSVISSDTSEILIDFLMHNADTLIRHFLSARQDEFPLPLQQQHNPQKNSAQAWFASLSNKIPLLADHSHEIARLEQRLRRWNRTITPYQEERIQLCFAIYPPEENIAENKWKLEFRLQRKQDNSQYVTATNLWRGEVGFLAQSQFTLDDCEELLLKSLGKSLRVFEPLSRALADPFPAELELSLEEAYEFLRRASSQLESMEFSVRYPSWWAKQTSQFGLVLEVNKQDKTTNDAQSQVGINQLLDYSWKISAGDKIFSIEEFQQLAASSSPMLQINGQWVAVRSPEIDQALQFLEARKENPLTLGEALRLGLGMELEQTGLPIVHFDSSGWVKRLLDAQPTAVVQPANFNGSLRPYQLEGVSWISFLDTIGCGGCLADDMGLGKTIQFIAFLLYERENSKNFADQARPTLLVVPMSIIDNWQRELERFAPSLKSYIHHGQNRLAGDAFREKVEQLDVVLTTYSLLARDEASLQQVRWRRITLDEAQNIKNLQTKQTQAVRRIIRDQLSRPGGLCSRIALTGTPLENRLEELWSVLDFLNPGYLSSVEKFRSTFVLPIERYRDEERATQLQKLVSPFILRRLKSDKRVIQDLPEKMEMDVYTPLTEEQASLYQSVLADLLPQVEHASGIKRKGLVLSIITKLKQICDHPALYLKEEAANLSKRSGKLMRLEELLEVILAEGDKVLIFTQYAQMGTLLKKHLQDVLSKEVLFMHGGIAQKARQKMVDHFQSPAGPPIFVLSLKVGGFGLNLTAANQIIHYDQWWNPAVQEQATDRAYRIGQKRNVQVRKFISQGTLEERIASMLAQKRHLVDSVVQSSKNILTQMSTEELEGILKLSSEFLFDQQSSVDEDIRL